MAEPARRGGWPGPRKDTAWTFKPDPEAKTAVESYMDKHRLTGEWGGLTKALNAMLAAPQIRSEYDADGVLRHRDATGREYSAVTVDGELTYQPTDTEGE